MITQFAKIYRCFTVRKRGITLLLVILVMASLMTISLGIFNVSIIELQIAGDVTSSFRALYAADTANEIMQYEYTTKLKGTTWEDNPSGYSICNVQQGGTNLYCRHPNSLPNNETFVTWFDKNTPNLTRIHSEGLSSAVLNARSAKRSTNIDYNF